MDILGALFSKAPSAAPTVITTIAKQPITVGMAKSWIGSAGTIYADALKALDHKFKNVDEDFVVAEDVAGLVAQLPVVGTYGSEAKAGLEILQFVYDYGTPADANSAVMKRAEGQPNNPGIG